MCVVGFWMSVLFVLLCVCCNNGVRRIVMVMVVRVVVSS